MRLILLNLIAAVAANNVENASWNSEIQSAELFETWKKRHGKTYHCETEHSRRLGIFRENMRVVSTHNEAHKLGYTSYEMTLDGPFSDLTDDEFSTLYLMEAQNCSATHTSSGMVPRREPREPLPDAYDWRTKGVMTPVKNQQKCGSCWTFSTTGTLEGHHCIAEKKDCTEWVGLAEQQLIDCAGDFDNHGCNGGLPSHAFEYIHYNGGIVTEDAYDYTAKDGACDLPGSDKIGATVREVFNITVLDEDEIVAAVADIGPVSVAYQVSPDFRLYSHGVYDSWNATTNSTGCHSGPMDVNHAVVAVGYGVTKDDDALPFYIIRNSWGNTWGMEGHFWILRGKNLCGISDCASFPIVEASGKEPQDTYLRSRVDHPGIVSS